MKGTAFMSVDKLSGNGRVLQAARHNRRTLAPEVDVAGSINPASSHLNETLHGPPSPEAVAALAKALAHDAVGNRTIRKDAVWAIEVVFSLPVNHNLPNERAYFERCWRWAANEFGGIANILSVDVHRDEAAPHCHVLVLPLLDGRLQGARMLGYKSAFSERQTRFQEQVAQAFGLGKAPGALSAPQRKMAARTVRQCLEARQDPALGSATWLAIRQSIEVNPLPFLQLLDLPVPDAQPRRRQKTMAEIFTSPGKGPKVERNSIDFARAQSTGSGADKVCGTMQNLSCVDFVAEARMEHCGEPLTCATAGLAQCGVTGPADRPLHPAGQRSRETICPVTER